MANSVRRRDFLKGAAAAGAGWMVARGLPARAAADARLDILLDEPIGLISPDLYGHFVEHLGGVIYDGIWVGEQSKIPNVRGIRRALVEKMAGLTPSIMRWPGGCFADNYDWRDGIGPAEKRPRRTDFWVDTRSRPAPSGGAPLPPEPIRTGPQDFDPNTFGLHEFMRFCTQTKSTPYLAANVRSLPAKDFYQWVEYCNAPAGVTTLSDQRAAAGDRDPFKVRYWGIGNESWGCGGNFTPEEYATEFRKFTAWVPRYGLPLSYIAAGPNGGDLDWTTGFFRKLTERGKGQLDHLYGFALHYYCGSTGKRNAVDFTTPEWYELLAKADRMESLITSHWAAMGETDPTHKVKLIVDEWGAWHARAADMPESYLWAYPGSLRDALVSALTLDTFHRHADKVAMANVAQLINTIHSLFLAHEDKFVATPNYHVFEMYGAHAGGTSVRTSFVAPRIEATRDGKPHQLWGLGGSASLHDKTLVVTVVNPHATEPRECELAIRGAKVTGGRARILSSTDLRAHNSFAAPEALVPRDADVPAGAVAGGSGPLVYTFAPASVTRLRLTLA